MRIAQRDLPHALYPAPVRVWSLIATLYGDAVLARGGQLWLGTVTALLGEVEIGPEAVRAAMSRLARDGFLTRERAGRTSHYALSPKAAAESAKAARLIYRRTPTEAPAGWSFVLVDKPGAADLALLASEGFLAAAPSLFVRPGRTNRSPAGLLFDADGAGASNLELAARLFPLDDLAARYRRFCDGCALLMSSAPGLDPLAAMTIRLLAVHAFRRIVLRDPHLHRTSLPADWPAREAHRAFADLYEAVLPATERWLDEEARNAAGPLPPAQPHGRFCDQIEETRDRIDID